MKSKKKARQKEEIFLRSFFREAKKEKYPENVLLIQNHSHIFSPAAIFYTGILFLRHLHQNFIGNKPIFLCKTA
ncbi:MAG: hypothetical protein LBH84_08295 [Prevotellaceae bacterium]|nr:hypothetical protein [Prevotellaceae bacterium]